MTLEQMTPGQRSRADFATRPRFMLSDLRRRANAIGMGKFPFTIQEFYTWCRSREDYRACWQTWADAGFPRGKKGSLSPTVERFPVKDGSFSLENMRVIHYKDSAWVTEGQADALLPVKQ